MYDKEFSELSDFFSHERDFLVTITENVISLVSTTDETSRVILEDHDGILKLSFSGELPPVYLPVSRFDALAKAWLKHRNLGEDGSGDFLEIV